MTRIFRIRFVNDIQSKKMAYRRWPNSCSLPDRCYQHSHWVCSIVEPIGISRHLHLWLLEKGTTCSQFPYLLLALYGAVKKNCIIKVTQHFLKLWAASQPRDPIALSIRKSWATFSRKLI